jgi:hypothetical protein
MKVIAAMVLMGITICVVGCQSYSGIGASGSSLSDRLTSGAPALATSLFPGDQAVMTDSQIEQVLAAKVLPPDHGRVAVVRMGERYPYGLWSEDVAALDQQTTQSLLSKIRSSRRVSDVLLLPSLLVPQQMTVPYLRVAAARVQAHSILVYRTFSQTYQTSRIFGGDETRAYCTVEALLLDTRTGIITTTSVATQNWSAKQTSKDINFDETVAKAEQAAIGRALDKVADEMLRYMNTLPVTEMPTSQAAGVEPGK